VDRIHQKAQDKNLHTSQPVDPKILTSKEKYQQPIKGHHQIMSLRTPRIPSKHLATNIAISTKAPPSDYKNLEAKFITMDFLALREPNNPVTHTHHYYY
jgi:hypothetical protein